MWDQTLIESRRHARGKQAVLTFPLALILHLFVATAIVVISIWQVQVMQPVFGVSPFLSQDIIPTYLSHPVQRGERHATGKQLDNRVPDPTVEDRPIRIIPEDGNTPSNNGTENEGYGDPNGSLVGVLVGVGTLGELPLPEHVEPVLTITAGVNPPRLLSQVKPDYPASTRRLGIQGTVVMRAIIDKAGNVEHIEVLQSVHPLLDKAAINAVKEWKYRAATLLNGQPVKISITISVTFKLDH